MKILSTLILSSVIAVGGYYKWQRSPQPKPVPGVPVPDSDSPDAVPGREAIPSTLTAVVIAPEGFDAKKATVSAPAATASAGDTTGVIFEDNELITAVEQGSVQATMRGNGRDRMVAQLRNNSPTPLRLSVPAGQVFDNGRNLVIVLRTTKLELMPAQSAGLSITTAALLSSNKVVEGGYKLSYQYVSRVMPLLKWLADHPEVSVPAAQTAVLALMENLPVNALAKFAPANGITSKMDTDAYRVETSDLIAALTALKGCGARIESLALANDQQLKLELMIEPLSREAAKRFYGIAEETEWEFWKDELLNGEPSTRHYALFGIARFYPEIALEMLPKWVREAQTHPVYRMSALQAIADTQKPEALSILRQLEGEFGPQTELGKAAAEAAKFLDQRLSQLVEVPVVAFRGKPTGTTGL